MKSIFYFCCFQRMLHTVFLQTTNFHWKLPVLSFYREFSYINDYRDCHYDSPDLYIKAAVLKHLMSWSYSRASYHSGRRFVIAAYFILCWNPRKVQRNFLQSPFQEILLSFLSELCNSFKYLRKQNYAKMYQSWKLTVIAFIGSISYNRIIG